MGTSRPWQIELDQDQEEGGIPPLSKEEQYGSTPKYNRNGDPLGVDSPPLQPRPDQDVVLLLTRPVVGPLGLLVVHSATIIQTKDGDYVVQSGPGNNDPGLNIAQGADQLLPPGEGRASISKEGAMVTIEAKWFVPAGHVSKAKIQDLVNEWNSYKAPYFEKGSKLPVTTCNTFSYWFERKIGLKPPGDVAKSILYGWKQKTQGKQEGPK